MDKSCLWFFSKKNLSIYTLFLSTSRRRKVCDECDAIPDRLIVINGAIDLILSYFVFLYTCMEKKTKFTSMTGQGVFCLFTSNMLFHELSHPHYGETCASRACRIHCQKSFITIFHHTSFKGYKSHKIFVPVIEWLYFSISWENKWRMLDFVFFQHVSMGNINWVLFLFARRRRHSNRLLICWKYRNPIECEEILRIARVPNEMSVYIQFSSEFICRELEV